MLPAVLIAVATVLVLGLLPFLTLRSYGRRVERSGSDEADKVHRLRRVALGGVFVGALVVSAVWGAFLASAVDTGPGRGVFLVGMLLSLVAMSLGVSLGVGPAYRRIRGIHQSAGERFRKGLRVSLVFLIPMGLWFGIRLGFGSVFEEQPILRLMGWIVFVILFTATTPFLIVWLVPGRPPPGDLAARIATLAGRLRVRIGGVRLLESRAEKVANALVAGTIPRWRYVFLTDHLVARFAQDEVDAVVAHELGHAKQHHLLVKLGVFLGLYGVLTLPVLFVNGGGGDGDGSPVVAILTFGLGLAVLVGLFLVQGAVGIWLEKRADRFAAEAVGADAMVRSLEKLSTENAARKRTGRVWNLLHQHPGIEERIQLLKGRDRPEAAAA